MTNVFIRTILLYFLVLLVIRIMGKAELSRMSPFQMVVVFMIAELASIPIESPEVSMITGVTAIFTLMFLQVLISFISLKSERFKNFFSGKPSVLIDKGNINKKELKKLRITINDLMEQLRIGSAPSITEVDYAILESNGDLSIIRKSEHQPLTAKDIALPKTQQLMPTVFISDGIRYEKNILKSGWSKEQLEEKLLSLGVKDHEKVFLAFCDSNSTLHIFVTDEDDAFAKEVTS